MPRWRFRLVYLVLMPAIAVAAAILGYFTWRTAAQYARLGEETIAQSTLLIVGEKVDDVERDLIAADNAVFNLVDLETPTAIEQSWPRIAPTITPSVRAVLILNDSGNVLAYAIRGNDRTRAAFLKVFVEQILPDLELERQTTGRLKHLHHSYGGNNYLISYKALRHRGRRYYTVVQHDTGWIARERFPSLFATEEGKRVYNVVDENNRRVYGESLARSGDYVMGRRFPTTLYSWRLQVAPKQAPLLGERGRSRSRNEVALVAVAFVVILLGVAFVLYAADKERRLNALKSEFIANVSHELKTPLSVVRMFGEMLLTKRVASEEKRQEYLELICRETERLSTLIENVLDFAAVERGKRQYAMDEGDVVTVVQRAIEAYKYRIERKGTEVKLHCGKAGTSVVMDQQAVLLAIVNLLDNAVKHGSGDTVDVRIESKLNEVHISVKDDGNGIPEDDLERVFERFYRAPGAKSRGSGIGLALVKQIAEAHGGRAWATNTKPRGAQVGFSIPRGLHAEPAPREPASPIS